MTTNNHRFFSRQKILLLLVFSSAVIAVKWRFWPWIPEVFFGDDLANLLAFQQGAFASTVHQALAEPFTDKFRPFFALAMHWLFSAFGENIKAYMAANVLLQSASATLVFAIAQRLSSGRWVIAFAVMLAVATSRFALYQVTQVTGVVEGLALFFFLSMLYCAVRIRDSEELAWRWSWLAVVAAFLAANTHERYVVLFPWLCCVFVLEHGVRKLSRGRQAALFAAIIVAATANFAYKVVALHVPVLMGTGGVPISFSTADTWSSLVQAVLSIFGVNYGPPYLVAVTLPDLDSLWAWLFAAMLVLGWLVGVTKGIRVAADETRDGASPGWRPFAWLLLLFALGAMLLLPPVMTIRMEQRWLLDPFIVMLLVFAWAAGLRAARDVVPMWAVALAIAASSIALDSMISRHFNDIFFVHEAQFAAAAKKDIVDASPSASFELGLIAGPEKCSWTLLDGQFFRIYGGSPRTVRCFDTLDSLSSERPSEEMRIYSFDPAQGLTDVTDEARTEIICRGGIPIYDFLKNFSNGVINDPVEVSTPTGKGVLPMTWDSSIGLRDLLVVVSSFAYRYDGISINRNSKLCFGVGMLYPSDFQATAIVSLIEGGSETPHILYKQDLTPPRVGEKPSFVPQSISLAAFAGKTVALSFAVETNPSQNGNGHWIGFAAPRIVVSDAHGK